jgi:hypothetical protein
MKTDDLDGVAYAMIGVSVFCCVWIAAVMTWRHDGAGSIHAPEADELEPPVTDTVEHRLT